MRNVVVLLLLVGIVTLSVVVLNTVSLNLVSFGESPVVSPFPTPSTGSSNPSVPGANEVERLNLINDLTAQIDYFGATDNVSLYYYNLNNHYEVAVNADRSWIPASMVKAYVVVEAFRQKRDGLINFDSRVVVNQNSVVPTELELPQYQPLRAGVKATIRELVYAMVVQSDNTAFNTLLDVLDRRNISATLKSLGLTDTVVGEKLSLSDDQYAVDLAVSGRQPNRTTARDFGKLFTLLYQSKIPDAPEILAIFKQQSFRDMIPALLPPDTVIAHKTGTWSPYFHDGGVVYKLNEPFILVVFSNRDDPKIVAQLAKICYFKTRDVVLGAKTESVPGMVIGVRESIAKFLHFLFP